VLSGAVMLSFLLVISAFAIFAVVHSLVAGSGLKRWLAGHLGELLVHGWYRLAYNVFAGITLLPVLALVALLPDRTLYSVGLPWSLLMVTLQLVAIVSLAVSLLMTDIGHFTGISQAVAYLRGQPLPLPEPPLQAKGPYALVRHPLYTFSLLAIWLLPLMTVNVLAFNVAATVYFVAGSLVEERRLERLYGDAYRAYQQDVAWLIPWPRWRTSAVREPGREAAVRSGPEMGVRKP
jgi:protein-S-isoprenylcysteine O-methyltransferase Ste14